MSAGSAGRRALGALLMLSCAGIVTLLFYLLVGWEGLKGIGMVAGTILSVVLFGLGLNWVWKKGVDLLFGEDQ